MTNIEKCPFCGSELYNGDNMDPDSFICFNHSCFLDGWELGQLVWKHLSHIAGENRKMRLMLENVEKCGHNDDCLFCARKDTISRRTLEALEVKDDS
uniref:Uncharacterized protein n=1 Tax=viral metagenome TaxID=1070528 RepID=A0A6M3LRU2_9ZZZZ